MLALCVTTANAQIQWLSADVGTPTFKGSAVLNGDGTWTIQGGGDDIWNDSSDFHYLYAWASGTNWDVSAQFVSFTGPDTWSKVELLVDWADTTIGPQGKDEFIAMMDTQPSTVTPPDSTVTGENAGGVDQWRSTADSASDWLQVGTTPAPDYPNDWFRIQRQGSIFNLFKGTNGTDWNLYISIDTSQKNVIGQDNGTTFGTPWPDLVAVGVAVTAHNDTWVDPSTELAAGATAVIGNLQATFPPAVPPSALGVSQQIQSGTTNGLYCEASLTFAATNNAFPISSAFPVLYQWYKNNSAVVNATNTSYTWLLQPSDSGATCYCQASMAAPYNGITLNSATGRVGTLPIVYYTNGLKMEFFSYAATQPGPGTNDPRLWVEQGNVGPATWEKLEANMDDPGGYGNYYAARVSGWFLPPTSDTYTFYVASDDDSDLFLSTDNTIANKRLIAQETGWMNIDQWLIGGTGTGSFSQNCSDTFTPDNGNTFPFASGIALNAGQPYYIENVHYQGNGGDCMSVTYQTATMKADPNWTSLFTNGTPSLLYASNNVLMSATVPATSLTWVAQPTNTTTTVGLPAHFYSQASSDSQLQVLYQWYKGTPPTGVAIAGATTANYSTANAVAGDSGTTYYVVATTPENELTITSSVATENVALPVLEYGWAKDELWYVADPGIAAFVGTQVTNGTTGFITTYLGTSYAGTPDDTIFEPKMETTSLDNSGQSDYTERVSAFFYPPATDDYVFFVNSDDQSDLYISTDNTPANAVLVAQEINWSNPWQWLIDEGNTSMSDAHKCSATWTDANGNPPPWATTGIHMVKGTPYYIAGIHYQGGGGVNFEATFMSMGAYTANGNVGPADGTYSAFTGNLIASYVPQCFSMSFVQQPSTVTVPLGGLATFTAVGATDSKSPVGNLDDPYALNQWTNTVIYQWTKNGVPIQGAVSSSYSFGPVSPLDSSIKFACTIRALGYVSSGNPLWSTSSIVNVVVSGVGVYEPGFALHEYWSLNPGVAAIENNAAGAPTWLMASPAFEVDVQTTEIADNFSDELVGFFIPPTTGNYVFFGNSDDNSDLWLSTDDSASGRRLIAQEINWDGGLDWGVDNGSPVPPGQTRSDTFIDPTTGITLYSNGIPLIAGQKYFMQQVHHQGGGGTWNGVNYMLTTDLNYGGPGIGAPTSGSLSLIRGSQVGTYVPACTYVTVTNQPQSVTVNSYASTTFTAGAATDSTVPVGSEYNWSSFFNNFLEFQWYKNSQPVAGATTSAFAMPEVLPSDNNSSIYCIMRALGYGDTNGNALWQTSQVATLTVNITAPQLSYAAMNANSNYLNWGGEVTQYITLTFSTPMNPVQLNQASSYILPSGLTLMGIVVSSNYESVALAVSGTLASGAQIGVSSLLAGLGGGLPLTGSTSFAVSTTVPLTDMDIGTLDDPAVPGVMYVNGAKAYTIQCEGSDQWNNADGFNFAYEMKTNDFDVVVRMKSTTHVSDWTKGGLMVRETLDPFSLFPLTAGTSRNWNIVNDPVTSDGIAAVDGTGYGANTIECNCRTNAGDASKSWETGTAWPPAYPNAWVRLARVGTVLNAYASTDGASWTLLASADPTTNSPTSTPLPSVVYVGISTSAHHNDTVGVTPLLYVDTAVYDNFGDFVPVQTITMGKPVRGVGTITFTWTPTGVGTLYSSPALTGPNEDWEPVTNGTGTAGNITVPIGSGPLFFRVHNP